jgi:signal transduction histidine kinase
MSGHERLARLNHVATIMVSQSEYAKFNHWNDDLEQVARQDGDARYLALVDLNRLAARAQDGDQSVVELMRKIADTTKDWYVRVQAVAYIALNTDDAGAALKALSDIETTVVPSDPDANWAYAIIWESTGIALKDVADLEAVTEALSRSEYYSNLIGYPRPDFDSIYNLTKLVTLVGDGPTARQLITAHHTLSLRSGLPHLMPWDMGLCAQVAEKFGTPQETMACLKDLSPNIPETELLATGVLPARALALARLGRADEAQADLDRLKALQAKGGFGQARFMSMPLIETEILAARGQAAAALNGYRKYLLTSSWAQADLSRHGIHQITTQMREQLGTMRHNAELKQRMIYVQWGLGVLAILIMSGGALVVAQQRRLNAKLKRAQQHALAANRTKSEFLANMSHEIRTPLNGVLGMAEVIAAGELIPSQRERLEVVRQSGKALLTIINDILDLSKIEAGRLELEYLVFDFGKLVHDVAAAFAPLSNEKRLELTVLISQEAEGSVWGDPTRTRQILSNLISNAIKFTEKGGVTLRVERSGDILSVAVEDTGIGMAPEVANRIFNKFEQADGSVTRRFGGTGLGLSIARQLATAMGGRIDVSPRRARALPLSRVWLSARCRRRQSRYRPPSRSPMLAIFRPVCASLSPRTT